MYSRNLEDALHELITPWTTSMDTNIYMGLVDSHIVHSPGLILLHIYYHEHIGSYIICNLIKKL